MRWDLINPHSPPGSPVAIKIGVGVLRIFLLMLAPARIVEVNGVRGLVILVLQGGEELVDDVLFGPIAIHPGQRGQHDYGNHRR